MFESLIRKNVKCVYQDGSKICIRDGILVKEENDFVLITTDRGDSFIKLSQIQKIEEAE